MLRKESYYIKSKIQSDLDFHFTRIVYQVYQVYQEHITVI